VPMMSATSRSSLLFAALPRRGRQGPTQRSGPLSPAHSAHGRLGMEEPSPARRRHAQAGHPWIAPGGSVTRS
jgi:hypothetical protein